MLNSFEIYHPEFILQLYFNYYFIKSHCCGKLSICHEEGNATLALVWFFWWSGTRS